MVLVDKSPLLSPLWLGSPKLAQCVREVDTHVVQGSRSTFSTRKLRHHLHFFPDLQNPMGAFARNFFQSNSTRHPFPNEQVQSCTRARCGVNLGVLCAIQALRVMENPSDKWLMLSCRGEFLGAFPRCCDRTWTQSP